MSLTTLAMIFALSADAAPANDKKDAEKSDQEVASGLQQEGVQKAKFDEIERGFNVRIPVGVMWYLTPVRSQATNNTHRFGPGMQLGLDVGYDVHEIVNVGAFFNFAYGTGTGASTAANPARDLTSLYGGAFVQVSVFHTKRFFLNVRAGGGYGLQDALIERLQHGAVVTAALGFEYFTRIRHISIAFDAGALIWITPSVAVGLTLLPSFKYTY